jgi:hypothetical protein
MRSPEGDDPPPNPSLITDPPADPPPADPPADPPPADPPADPSKPADPPADPPAPLTVESLTLPEGFELQPEMASEFLEILNGDQSPQDRANALIALHGKTLTEASEASSKLWDGMQTEWKDEVKADPDIGGAKLQPTLTNIGKLLDEYGTPELKGVFDLTGAGNNLHMIKFLNKIAEKLTEGKLFTAGSPAGANDPDAVAKRMFPLNERIGKWQLSLTPIPRYSILPRELIPTARSQISWKF